MQDLTPSPHRPDAAPDLPPSLHPRRTSRGAMLEGKIPSITSLPRRFV